MTIEAVICPILNANLLKSNYQALIRFHDLNENPVHIMCDDYDSEKKICTQIEKPCIYSSWKAV